MRLLRLQVMLRKETEWMRRQPRARGTKAKARVNAFEELTAQARSGPIVDVKIDFGNVAMARQGQKVIVMKVCFYNLAFYTPRQPW